MKKVKHELFPQSFAIDSLLAKKRLIASGFEYTNLESPILYRGDERGPEIIFKTGFYRKPQGKQIPLPDITLTGESDTCVATTKDLVYAVGFADNPSTTMGAFKQPKKSYGWVYLLYADNGIDLTLDKKAFELAHYVKEVVLTGIPPEHIIAAFQIKTTNNKIYPYIQWCAKDIIEGCNHPLYENVSYNNVSWQIICTKFEKNPNFSKNIDLLPYQKDINDFLKVVEKGSFRIPWSPYAEKKLWDTKKVNTFFNSVCFETNEQTPMQTITSQPKL